MWVGLSPDGRLDFTSSRHNLKLPVPRSRSLETRECSPARDQFVMCECLYVLQFRTRVSWCQKDNWCCVSALVSRV